MKKTGLIILFVFATSIITLFSVTLRKNSTNVDIKLQDVEAFGGTETSDRESCTRVGGMCIVYEDGQTIFLPGISYPF